MGFFTGGNLTTAPHLLSIALAVHAGELLQGRFCPALFAQRLLIVTNITDKELRSLQQWRIEVDKARAVEAEQFKHLQDQVNRLEKAVNNLNSTLNRLVWTIITTIIGGVMGFIVKGGLVL